MLTEVYWEVDPAGALIASTPASRAARFLLRGGEVGATAGDDAATVASLAETATGAVTTTSSMGRSVDDGLGSCCDIAVDARE